MARDLGCAVVIIIIIIIIIRRSLLTAGCHQRNRYCQPAVTSEFAADSQYNLWMKLGGLLHGSICLAYSPYFK